MNANTGEEGGVNTTRKTFKKWTFHLKQMPVCYLAQSEESVNLLGSITHVPLNEHKKKCVKQKKETKRQKVKKK